jgi:hypothetical protein
MTPAKRTTLEVLMKTTTLTPEGKTRSAEEEDRERIQRLAYHLYEQRGKVDGSDLDDWLRAESELTVKKPVTTWST